jgi:hypothetical protein
MIFDKILVKLSGQTSDFTCTTTTAINNGPLTNQMRLIYPINQSDAFDISN